MTCFKIDFEKLYGAKKQQHLFLEILASKSAFKQVERQFYGRKAQIVEKENGKKCRNSL